MEPTNPKWTRAWKVLTPDLTSCFADPPWSRSYRLGKATTFPGLSRGFVFATEGDAMQFANLEAESVYSCLVLDARPWRWRCRDSLWYRQWWTLKRPGCSWHSTEAPEGTLVVKAVILEKEVYPCRNR
jgi:hypothetical protein